MNEQLDSELMQVESLLRRTASNLSYPPTPDLASSVRVRLNEGSRTEAMTWRPFGKLRAGSEGRLYQGFWRRPAFAASGLLAALVIVLGAAIAVPTSRSALADFFGLSHVRIERDDGTSPTPSVLAPGNFARPSTLDEVRGIVDFPLRLPTEDGRTLLPDAVYIQGEAFNAPIAIFVYSDYDIYETRGAYIQKLIGGADVEKLSFDGHDAYWVEQGGHIVQSLDSDGRVVIETRRTVDRATLIWEEGGITYRIESSLPQAETVAVAQSLR